MSMVWPKIAAQLYFLDGATSEEEVQVLVQCIMSLCAHSLGWKFTINSALEGLAVRTTYEFAKFYSGLDKTWIHYFQQQFKLMAYLLNRTQMLKHLRDYNLLSNVEDLSANQLHSLVPVLRKAKRATSSNLCELLQYTITSHMLFSSFLDSLARRILGIFKLQTSHVGGGGQRVCLHVAEDIFLVQHRQSRVRLWRE